MAAGRSRRFGRSRVNKLLAPLRGRSVVAQVLTRVMRAPARPLIVVTGHQRGPVQRELSSVRGRRYQFRFNPRYRRGMASSLQAGIRALPASIDGAVICLGDMPGVRTRTIKALIAAYRQGDDAVIPRVGDRRGNPVLLGRALLDRAAELAGDQGARRLLAGSSRVRLVDADDSVLLDIDTRRDWRRQRQRKSR